MAVELCAQLIDDGDRLIQRPSSLFSQFFRCAGFVEPRFDGGGAFFEAADDVLQA